jgi:hypothetical protein
MMLGLLEHSPQGEFILTQTSGGDATSLGQQSFLKLASTSKQQILKAHEVSLSLRVPGISWVGTVETSRKEALTCAFSNPALSSSWSPVLVGAAPLRPRVHLDTLGNPKEASAFLVGEA